MMRKFHSFLFCIFLLQGCQDARPRKDGVEVSPDSPLVTSAVHVATDAFGARLAKEGRGEWKYASYVADVKNYTLDVRDLGDYFEIEFLIKQPPDGSVIKGGGGKYRLDKKTSKIVSFEGYK